MESIMQYISVHWVSWVFGIIAVCQVMSLGRSVRNICCYGCQLVWPGSSWMTGSGTELLESSGRGIM